MDIYQSFLDLCDKFTFTKSESFGVVLIMSFLLGVAAVLVIQLFIRLFWWLFRKLKLHFQSRK